MNPFSDPFATYTIRERAFVLKIKLSALRDRYVRDFLPGAPALADEASQLLDELLARLGLEPTTKPFPPWRTVSGKTPGRLICRIIGHWWTHSGPLFRCRWCSRS